MAIVAKKRGRGRASSPSYQQGAWQRALRWAAAAVLLALAAVLAWRWAAARSESSPHPVGNGDVAPPAADEPPAPPVTHQAVPETPPPAPEKGAAARSESSPYLAGNEDVAPPVPPAPPPPARTNHVLNYRTGARAAEHIKSEADQIIAFAVQGRDFTGEMPPFPEMHWPDGGNAIFLASLTNEIAVLDDDPPGVREQKEAMLDFRAQIKGIIDGGGTFEEAIREYRDWVNECANLRLAAIREYQALRAEDPEAAEEYRLRANEELEAAGATPLPSPSGRGGRGRKREGVGE